jgi:hypothetical protein
MGPWLGYTFTICPMYLGVTTWHRSVDWYGNVTYYTTWMTG